MSTRSGVEALRDRSSIGWLRERDIDLLLCSELHAAGALRDRFAGLWPDTRVQFAGAWVSHAEIDGESDLVIAFQDGETHFILLVENKIAADFQPDQATRYVQRATRWRQLANVEVTTVLICPSEYLSRPSSEIFDAAISYEDLIESIRGSFDDRSIFLANALSDGIESYRRGYVAIPDQTVTGIWEAIWRTASTEHPSLNMERPSTKPGKATWIYFQRPSGFSDEDVKRCVIAYKAERGQVDLQFTAMRPSHLAEMLVDLLEADMSVEKARKSSSVRISVPSIDFATPPEAQKEAICQGLRQAERLRRFFVENRIRERLRSSHPM